MLVLVVLAVVLPCVGFSALSLVYTCLLWYTYDRHRRQSPHGGDGGHHAPSVVPRLAGEKGLSKIELEKVPRVTGKDLVRGNDCAVCLDEIGSDEGARIVPGCNHGFHVQCADTWLSKHRVCPVCRAKLEPQFLNSFDTVNQMV